MTGLPDLRNSLMIGYVFKYLYNSINPILRLIFFTNTVEQLNLLHFWAYSPSFPQYQANIPFADRGKCQTFSKSNTVTEPVPLVVICCVFIVQDLTRPNAAAPSPFPSFRFWYLYCVGNRATPTIPSQLTVSRSFSLSND